MPQALAERDNVDAVCQAPARVRVAQRMECRLAVKVELFDEPLEPAAQGRRSRSRAVDARDAHVSGAAHLGLVPSHESRDDLKLLWDE